MRQEPGPWLPIEVVEHQAAQAPFDQALVAWRADWLPRLPLRIGGWKLSRTAPPIANDGEAWRIPHRCVAVSCGARARTRLANAALGLDLDAVRPNERDQAVLSGFCDRLLASLAERFEQTLGPSGAADPSRTPPAVVAAVEGDQGVLARIVLPAWPVAELYRRALPAAARKTNLLVDRRQALSGSAVQLEATLGEATITLPELRAMAPGDVLRLNRKLSDPARLSLVAGGGGVASGALTQSDGHLALRLQ